MYIYMWDFTRDDINQQDHAIYPVRLCSTQVLSVNMVIIGSLFPDNYLYFLADMIPFVFSKIEVSEVTLTHPQKHALKN